MPEQHGWCLLRDWPWLWQTGWCGCECGPGVAATRLAPVHAKPPARNPPVKRLSTSRRPVPAASARVIPSNRPSSFARLPSLIQTAIEPGNPGLSMRADLPPAVSKRLGRVRRPLHPMPRHAPPSTPGCTVSEMHDIPGLLDGLSGMYGHLTLLLDLVAEQAIASERAGSVADPVGAQPTEKHRRELPMPSQACYG